MNFISCDSIRKQIFAMLSVASRLRIFKIAASGLPGIGHQIQKRSIFSDFFFIFFLLLINHIENIFQKSGSTLASRYICTIKTNYELPITNYAWQYRIQFIALCQNPNKALIHRRWIALLSRRGERGETKNSQ